MGIVSEQQDAFEENRQLERELARLRDAVRWARTNSYERAPYEWFMAYTSPGDPVEELLAAHEEDKKHHPATALLSAHEGAEKQ